MELDNLIYIIITIAIFTISILSQFRKKKVPRPVQTEEPKYSLNDFEIFLEKKNEYFKKEEDKLENVIPEIEQVQDNAIVVKDDKEPEASQKEQKYEEEFNDGFDIKSAIIYSSILERKKFRH